MNTILVVTSDDALRARLMVALGEHSVCTAPNDVGALMPLRLSEIDVVVRGGAGMPRDVASFVARVRALAPSALTVAIGTAAEDIETADFTLPSTFTQRELDGVLRRVIDKLRLTREITALRSSLAPEAPGTAADLEGPWEGAAFARVLKEFTRAFAAGFDLPRALEMFLDAIGELVRPTRMALLLPDADAQEYRVATHRGLARPIVESVRLNAGQGLVRWLAAQGRPARLHDLTDPEIVPQLQLPQNRPAGPRRARRDPPRRPAGRGLDVPTRRDRDALRSRVAPGHRHSRHRGPQSARARAAVQRADPGPHVERCHHHRPRPAHRHDQPP